MKKGFKVLIIISVFVVLGVMFLLYGKSSVYDISSELGYNGEVIERGKIEGKNYEMIIEDFTSRYPLSEEKNNFFVFGDSEELKILSYEEVGRGEIGLALGKMVQKTKVSDSELSLQKIIPSDENVKIILNGQEYDFKISRDQIAYMVVSQDE
jgi:hypothetical protein